MTSTTSSTTVSTTKATQVTEVSITESSSHSETTTTTALSDPKQSVPAPAPTPPIHPFFTKSGLGTNTNTSGGSPTHTNPFSKVKWSKHGSVIVGTYGTQSANTHIAAFDFDGTLASVRGKHVYPKNGDDWRFFHPSIPSRLVSLSVDEGFRIVIMSNQKDIEKNKQRKAAFMGRVENVVRAIELYAEKEGKAVPSILVFGAVEDDWCRKPRPGMWELLETDFNNGVAVDKEHSFYVGDAAGRPQDHVPGTKRDFADTDYKFALNVRCQFYTPEGFFHFKTLDQAVPAHKAQHPSHAPPDPAHLATDIPPGRHPELVILVGLPASGKSRFALHKLVPHGYTRVNQDLLKTRDKCLKTAEHALMNNPHKSVVVDNTNPDRATRRAYVEMARRVSGKLRVGVGVRCFEFVTPEEVCLHNNAYRSLVEPHRDRVPRLAYQQFHARYQKPDVSEGFDEVITVEFAAEFRNEEEEEVWQMYFV
ncbi:polynucleotide kinase 3 phosphatase-domain-containing protein [Gaertneriomyces semiglobifer]|nr:polynucleotide kinase 3 phosphatase-domain-containing protein [Gaertneriomyces semiglobifer]